MAKRFGRNSRRKLRETTDALTQTSLQLKSASYENSRLRSEIGSVRSKCEQEVRAARRARDSVRISVDSLIDPRERNVQMRAYFDNMSSRGPSTLVDAVTLSLDDIRMNDQFERESFVKYASEMIAEQALGQIVRLWRAR
jgi:hypothetical protein